MKKLLSASCVLAFVVASAGLARAQTAPCTDFEDTISNHISAGRATGSFSFFFSSVTVVGSGETLSSGFFFALNPPLDTVVSLIQTGPGAFAVGRCPAPPSIDSASAAVDGSSVTLSGTASDPNGDLQVVAVFLSGPSQAIAAADGTTSWTVTFADLDGGDYVARVIASDGALVSEIVEVPFSIEQAARTDPFSIVVFPDTQNYDGATFFHFRNMIDWVLDNKDNERIALVMHVGDIIGAGINLDLDQETSKAAEQFRQKGLEMRRLDGQVPYVLSRGNHDHFLGFTREFPPDVLARAEAAGAVPGSLRVSPGGDSHAMVVDAGGIQILAFGLQMGPPFPGQVQEFFNLSDEDIQWHDAVVQEFAGLPTAYTIHHVPGLSPGANCLDPHSTQQMVPGTGQLVPNYWSTIIASNPNAFFTVSGHAVGNVNCAAVDANDPLHGQAILEARTNYQDQGQGGKGYLFLARFTPAEQRVEVETLSATGGGFRQFPGEFASLPSTFFDTLPRGESDVPDPFRRPVPPARGAWLDRPECRVAISNGEYDLQNRCAATGDLFDVTDLRNGVGDLPDADLPVGSRPGAGFGTLDGLRWRIPDDVLLHPDPMLLCSWVRLDSLPTDPVGFVVNERGGRTEYGFFLENFLDDPDPDLELVFGVGFRRNPDDSISHTGSAVDASVLGDLGYHHLCLGFGSAPVDQGGTAGVVVPYVDGVDMCAAGLAQCGVQTGYNPAAAATLYFGRTPSTYWDLTLLETTPSEERVNFIRLCGADDSADSSARQQAYGAAPGGLLGPNGEIGCAVP